MGHDATSEEPQIGAAPPAKRGRGRPRGVKKVDRRRVVWRVDSDLLRQIEAEVGSQKWVFCAALNDWLRAVLAERAARRASG